MSVWDGMDISAEDGRAAEMDALLFGSGFVRRKNGGRYEHVPADEVFSRAPAKRSFFSVAWRGIVGGFVWGLGPNIGLAIAAPGLTPLSGRWWAAVTAIAILTFIGRAIQDSGRA